MLFWRLSLAEHAERLDGGYGLAYEGRWNSIGRRVTYCATGPSLCVLERLVHANRRARMPEMTMVQIEAPDAGGSERVELDDLAADWHRRVSLTQEMGDRWHAARSSLALIVPSVVVPLREIADRNVVLNHEHPTAANLRIVRSEVFRLDERLSVA